VIERQIDIATADGQMTTFVCHPERDAPHPVIVFFMDALGIREELRTMVRRIASTGFYVVLPNLFYRSGVLELGPDATVRDSTGRSKITPLVESLTIPLVMADADVLLRSIEADPAARQGGAGVIGYCLSGQYAINLAARHPQRFQAAASIYGTSLVTDRSESPHRQALRASAELYFACAEIDHWMPLEAIAELRAGLTGRVERTEIELFPNYEHGFAFPARHSYNLVAAERHWERLFALFERNLKSSRASTTAR